MIRKNWLGKRGRVASVVAFFFTLTILGNGVHAQSGQSASGGSVLKPASPPAFLVAPSMPLGFSPTSMAAGTLTSSGRVDLVTADPSAGKITVFTGLGHGTFSSGNTYAAGAQPVSLVVADIDGDGKPDVLLANPSEGVISFFAGNGDGTLAARTTFAIGFAPSLIAVGDFTGNGKLDVAVAGAGVKTLAILQNDGTGNLKRPVNFSLDSTPAAIIAADFNHDGHVDLALANGNGTLSILLGKGNGQFSVPADVSVSSGPLTSIAAVDFNRDGNTDLVVTASAANQAAVLLGHGDGTFAPAALLQVGDSPVAAHVADVDGDGIPDLIIINKGSNTFSVLNGVGDGTFKDAAHFVVGNAPLGAAAADLYGSGHVDLATINQLGQTLSVPAGNGDGTFAAGRAYVAGVQPVAVAAGSLIASGKTDLVVGDYCGTDATCGGSGSAAVLLAGPGGIYQLASTYAMGAGSVAIHLIDVNGDGKADLVALNRVDKSVSVRLGAGDGTFGNLITIPLAGAPVALAAADFNKDGKTDLAVLSDCGSANCVQPGEVEFLLGSGDGNFHSLASYPVGFAPVALAAGKSTASGDTDVVVANRCGSDASCKSAGTATILLGDGTGAFKAGTDVVLGNSPSSIALADLRGAGIQDLVVSRSADNTIAILPGDGKGSFGAAVPYAVGHAPGKLVVADFNGDGQPDVAVANTADSTVSVLFGQKGGTLQPAFAVPVAGNPSALAAIAGATTSAPASLATTNGSTNSPVASSNVTVVSNVTVRPLVVGGIVPTIAVARTAGSSPSSVNASVTFTATVTGTTGNGAPTGGAVEFLSDGTAISDCGGAAGMTVTPGASPSLASTAVCATSVLTGSATGHAITAQYLGCPSTGCTTTVGDQVYDNSAVSTPPITQVVSALSTTLGLTGPASTTVGTSVTFTATLSASSVSPVTPSGTISFTINGASSTDCPPVTLSGGTVTANCVTQSLVSPADTIAASYASDPSYGNSSANTSITVSKAAPTVSLSSSPASPVVNQTITFTATVPSPAGGTPTVFPTGSVTVKQGATTLCGPAVLGSAYPPTASCTYAFAAQTAGVSLSAVYSGDANFTAGTPGPLTQAVGTASTTTVTSSSGSVNVNQPVTFTTTLTPQFAGSGIPQGTIAFSTNATTAPTGTCASTLTVAANGTVPTCTFTFSTAGTFTVSAKFTSANTNFSDSTSAQVSQVVNSSNLGIALTSGTNPSVTNQSVTFSSAFSPAITGTQPAGTVTYLDGATTMCSGLAVTSAGAIPDCSYAFPAAGSHGVYVSFTSSDNNFTNTTSNIVTQTVNKANTSAGVLSSLSTGSVVNQTVTFTATITPAFTGTVPTGTVAFSYTGPGAPSPVGICGTGVAVTASGSNATAACSAALPVIGSYTITAAYSGDKNFNSSTNTTPQTVGKASVTGTVSAPAASVNQGTTLTATIVPQFTGVTVPSGTVSFTDTTTSSTLCASSSLSSNGSGQAVASCGPVSFATFGPHTVSVNYAGDANFAAVSPVPTATQTVNTTNTTIGLSPTVTTPINTAVTYTATVTPAYTGTAIPQGTVTFTTTGTTLGTDTCKSPVAVQASGTASCQFTFTAAGTYSVTAKFNPSDSNFATSTSLPLTQIIGSGSLTISLNTSPASIVNQQVTFAAAFSQQSGTQPQGTVAYVDSINPASPLILCNATVATSGSIPSCTFAFAVAGNHPIQASYTPANPNFTGAASNLITQVVNKAATSGSVASSIPTSNVNQEVTFTATITPSQFASATLAVPTGTVNFYSNNTTICSNVPVKTGSGGSATATCLYAFGASGPYTIGVSYTGDSNFVAIAQGSSGTFSQTVGTPTSTIAVTANPTTSIVNQTVQFNIVITPANTGATSPTGTVTLSDTDATTQICQPAGVIAGASGTGTATCAITFLTAGTHAITANYGGDSNFSKASGSGSIVVSASPTTVLLSSSAPASFATQTVTFTATVQPAIKGSNLQAPAGAVTFTSSDTNNLVGAACPSAVTVAKQPNGTAQATCVVTFAHSATPVGQLSVNAVYGDTADANFAGSNASVPQTVQDFNVNLSVVPGTKSVSTPSAVYITQGNTTSTDVFGPATISIQMATSTGYNPAMSVTCEVYTTNPAAALTDPSCVPVALQTVNITQNAGAQPFVINASANAAPGKYIVRLTAFDPNFTDPPGNRYVEFSLFVVEPSPSLSIASGATGTQNVSFLTPGVTGINVASYSCPKIWDSVNKTMLDNTANSQIVCSGTTGSVSVSGSATLIPVSITAAAQGAKAQLERESGTSYLASLVGVPFFAIIAWFGTRRSSRKNLLRFFGLILTLIGISYVTGCGGSFSGSNPPTATGISAGSYLVQVVATDSSGANYYAEVPIVVVK